MHEAKTNCSKLVERALRGEEIVIARSGKPLLKLVPLEDPGAQHSVGLHRQEVGDDFEARSLGPYLTTSWRRGSTRTCSMTDVLLDTHALLWFDATPQRLPGRVVELIRAHVRRVHVSAVSVWELAMKQRLGKLPEAEALLKDYHRTLYAYGFTELPFTSVPAFKERELDHTYKDPFDRALVAQAQSEQFVILSKDPAVAAFPDVTVVWD